MSGNTNSLANLIGRWSKLYECELSLGPVTKENVFFGARVVRGPDWIYGNQDREGNYGYEYAHQDDDCKYIGTIVGGPDMDGYALVIWDTGCQDYYRIEDWQDLLFA